jgi:hypothetical protein
MLYAFAVLSMWPPGEQVCQALVSTYGTFCMNVLFEPERPAGHFQLCLFGRDVCSEIKERMRRAKAAKGKAAASTVKTSGRAAASTVKTSGKK